MTRFHWSKIFFSQKKSAVKMKATKRKNSKTFPTNSTQESKNANAPTKSATNRRPSRASMTWAVSEEFTADIYHDMGVTELVDDTVDNSPTTYNNDDIPVPQAPKVSGKKRSSSPGEMNEETPIKWVGPPHSDTDGCFICKKPRRELIEGNNSWNKLSDELILSIFGWLPKPVLVRCAQVCRRWNRLSFDESLWRRLDVSNRCLAAGVLGRIVTRGPTVLRLTKSEILSPIYTDSQTQLWNERANKVQYLDLSMATVSVPTLEALLKQCRNLRKLSLEHCPVSTSALKAVGQNKHLEVLNLSMCNGITIEGMVNVVNCLKLQELNLSWTSLTKECIVYTCICLPKTLGKLSFNGFRENVTDDDILQLVKACPFLTELDLSDSTLLTETSVDHLVKNLRGLEHVSLSRCYNISPAAFVNLKNVVALQAVDIYGMLRDSTVEELKETLRNIKINMYPFCSIARPTTGIRRSSVWGLRVRDQNV